MRLKNREPVPRGSSRELVVVIHAFASSSKKLRHVLEAVTTTLPDADLLAPNFGSSQLSNADPAEIALAISSAINDADEASARRGAPYERIYLVGHSLGALLIRKAFVFACGHADDSTLVKGGPGQLPARDWTRRVHRLVLLAGMNRGWRLHPRPRHMPFLRWLFLVPVMAAVSRLPVAGLIKSIRSGSPFVANLRLQWLAVARESGRRLPGVVQLLGSVDDVVDTTDSYDIQTDTSFVFKILEATGHSSIIRFTSDEAGQARRRKFVEGLSLALEDLKPDMILPPPVSHDTEHFVFIMHGIRDYGRWTRQCRQSVEAVALENNLKVEVDTSGYGYFPMMPFLLLSERDRNVRWFMDQYTEARALHPKARIGFIGHSNGTYLAARALSSYATVKFERLAFAGSVVPRTFPWDQLAMSDRIKAIRNDVASFDWVVAIFPRLFEIFGGSIGSGGFTGFQDNAGQENAVEYVRGDHGAAVKEANHRSLATFVLTGRLERNESLLTSAQPAWLRLLSRGCLIAWLVILAIIGGVAIGLWLFVPDPFKIVAEVGWAAMLLALLYLF